MYAALSFTVISSLTEQLISQLNGSAVFFQYNWFLYTDLNYMSQILIWWTEGLAISFLAYFYMATNTARTDGLRFGIIFGMLVILLVLFNMMLHLEQNLYPFFADSLLLLTAVQTFGFMASGWVFGLLYNMHLKNFNPTVN